DALEVQVHDQLAVRVALHVAQQDLLDLAVDVEVQDRRVEPLVLAGQPDVLVLELDGLRLGLAAVDDGRDLGGMTQAAARTLTFVSTAGGLDGVFGHFRYSLCLLWTASRRLETLTRDQTSVLRAGLPAPRNRVDRRGSIDVEGTHRFAERDAPDGFGQQFGDAELAHLAALARRLAQRDRVGHHQLVELRLADVADRCARQHRMGAVGDDLGRAVLLQRGRGGAQRAGGIDDVV